MQVRNGGVHGEGPSVLWEHHPRAPPHRVGSEIGTGCGLFTWSCFRPLFYNSMAQRRDQEVSRPWAGSSWTLDAEDDVLSRGD